MGEALRQICILIFRLDVFQTEMHMHAVVKHHRQMFYFTMRMSS